MTVVFIITWLSILTRIFCYLGGGSSAIGAWELELGEGGGSAFQNTRWWLVQRRPLSWVRSSVHLENAESCQSSCNSFAPVRPGRNLRVGDSHVFRILVGHVGRAWFPVPAAVGWLRRRRRDRPGAGPRSGCCSDLAPGCKRAVRWGVAGRTTTTTTTMKPMTWIGCCWFCCWWMPFLLVVFFFLGRKKVPSGRTCCFCRRHRDRSKLIKLFPQIH